MVLAALGRRLIRVLVSLEHLAGKGIHLSPRPLQFCQRPFADLLPCERLAERVRELRFVQLRPQLVGPFGLRDQRFVEPVLV